MNAGLQERIVHLERELVSAKLQLACAKSSEDHLKLDLAKTRLALAKATGGNVSTFHTESSRLDCAITKPTRFRNVDSANLLSRKSSRDELASYSDRLRKAPHTKRLLNPGSCSSALNLFAEIDPPQNRSTDVSRGGGALSLHRSNRLNPNSCASGLNLMVAQGLQSLATSGRMSLSSSTPSSISRKSSHDIALLIGSSRALLASSFSGRRRVGSRSNVSLSNNRYHTQGSGKGNSEWGELK